MSEPKVTQKQLDSAKETKRWFDSLNDSQFQEQCLKVANIIKDLWINRAKNAFYFHGTTESRLDSILREGLKPNELTGLKNFDMSRKEAVYLTLSRKEARDWACWTRKYKRPSLINWNIKAMAINRDEIKLKTHEREKAFVIVVPRSKIDQTKLQKDRNLNNSYDFEFHGIIEPPFEFYEVSEEL